MKWLVPFAVAIAAAMVLWGSAAGASPGGAVGPLAKGVTLSHHQIPLSKMNGAKPRGLDGVPAKGNYAFLLKLATTSTGRVYESMLSHGVSAARTAAKDQLATVRAAQSRVIAALPIATHVLYRTHAALSAVAVYTNVANLPALQRISGVAHVYPIAPKTPSNSYAVHLVKAPEVWQNYGDTGAGTSIAIIDTGIDYTHADFGGPGTKLAYQDALATDDQQTTPSYPDTNKVSPLSHDFAGDSYDANPNDAGYDPNPAPDQDPLDCNSHGTHTAGTAAGYGENPDGSTYTGDYTTLGGMTSSAYQALFRIGPGMAPEAKIYSYKVFGCEGSTNLVGAAIDAATDPDGNGNPSDHVDVISMSLGSDFASPQDGDSVEADAASALGVSVVAAAGNASDVYDVGGSPGNAQSAIGVAASVDAYNQIDTLHATVNGVAKTYGAQRSVAYDWANDPDFSGEPVVAITDSSNTDGCDPISQDLTGDVVFLEWTDDSNARRCGSAARSDNAFNAGASGVILGEDEETFAAGITGSADIPVVQVVKSAADEIRTALNASQTVTADSTSANDFQQLIPADDDKVAGFSSRGIRNAGDVKPDVSGVGVSVFSAGMGTGNDGLNDSGTSMATPQVAGLDALVRNANPTWTPEEVKADIMNTADQDLFTGDNHSGAKFAPNRVGAGRIDAQAALDSRVLAYVTDDPGAVSASFGPVAVTGPTDLTKTIEVDNKSGSSHTYDISYDPITQVPGVDYQLSTNQITLAAHTSTTVTVTLHVADPTLLTKTIDQTVDRIQTLPRDYVADASGHVLFAPEDPSPTLRVPVYSAPRPASSMTQASSLFMPGGGVDTASLSLTGAGVSQGSGDTAVQSLVAGFELQALSPALTGIPSDEQAADIAAVGTTSDAPQLSSIGDDPLVDGEEYFAINTHGPWHTAASQNEYDIYIDSDGDGVPDEVVFNTRLSATSDVFVTKVYDLNLGQVIDAWLLNDRAGDTDTAVFDSDTLVMPVGIDDLPGISVGHSRIHYGIVSFGQFSGSPVDFAGFDPNNGNLTLTADVLNPGVTVSGAFDGSQSPLLWADMPGTSLTVRRDAEAYAADRGLGTMMVHFHNTVGNKTQIVDTGQTLSVGKGGSGTGTVTSSPAGIDCGPTCTGSFATGTSVTLTATPAAGSRFAGWSGGGCSGTGTCRVTMSAGTTVTATFTLQHTLTVVMSGTGTGSVTSSPAGINCGSTCSAAFDTGTSVTLTAAPASDSTFAGWSGACTGTGTCHVTLTSNTSATATFTKKAAKDTTPPKITLLKVKVNHHKRTAKVTFRGIDPGNGSSGLRYRCKLDKGKFRSCRSPKLYKHLKHGRHTVRVKATDTSGNVSKTATKRFKV